MNLLHSIHVFAKDHPKITAFLGSASGWWSWDSLAKAKEIAQLGAAGVAGLVSLCALILTAPKALAEVRRWLGLARKK